MDMEMEEEGIGLVLSRASELRLKISNCIEKASTTSDNQSPKQSRKYENGEGGFVDGDNKNPSDGGLWKEELNEEEDGYDDDEDEEDESEKLLHIRDALESLETQLASLQDLRQRQQYERQVALAEIDYSRKMLLEKLKGYKGNALEVIRETSAFADEKVEHEIDLLLPPYPNRPPLVLENIYPPNPTSVPKPVPNGLINHHQPIDLTNKPNETRTGSENSKKGMLSYFISSVTKIVIPVIGVISILTLSGLGRRDFRTNKYSTKISGRFQKRLSKEERNDVRCPPGKILVVEDGEARCLVKERVEIPFDSFVSKPDINYGCG